MSTEQDGNQNMANHHPLYCRNGCGFYAAQAFDGMCSKCYKDLKHPPPPGSPPPPTTTASPSSSSSNARLVGGGGATGGDSSNDVDAVTAALSKTSLSELNVNGSSNNKLPPSPPSEGSSKSPSPAPPPEVETGSPTVPSATPTKQTGASGSSGGPGVSSPGSSEDLATAAAEDGDEKGKKTKKNRCQECRKKVGLTGFQCHCGKLFCSLHRYSDTHHCTFDFKEKGQQEIRRNNPVIKGEKVQKI